MVFWVRVFGVQIPPKICVFFPKLRGIDLIVAIVLSPRFHTILPRCSMGLTYFLTNLPYLLTKSQFHIFLFNFTTVSSFHQLWSIFTYMKAWIFGDKL